MRSQGILLGVLVAVLGTGCTIIEEGEVGVSISFGRIADEPVAPGVAYVIPVARFVERWNIKLQERKEQALVPSSEGLIVGLDISLLYRVEAQKAPEIRKTIGWNYMETLMIPYLRSAIRDVVAGYQVKDIYSETGRKEIAAKVKGYLTDKLTPYGINIQDLLLRDVQLPQRFRESIEAKLTAEQKAEEKTFELLQAEKEAEIEVARAVGAAEAQEIIRETLSSQYLQYLWIRTLNENPNVVYVATEANMPIFKTVK